MIKLFLVRIKKIFDHKKKKNLMNLFLHRAMKRKKEHSFAEKR